VGCAGQTECHGEIERGGGALVGFAGGEIGCLKSEEDPEASVKLTNVSYRRGASQTRPAAFFLLRRCG